VSKRHLLIAGIPIAFVLVACGGDGSDDQEIADTIVLSAKSDDPADCTRLATTSFLEQTQKQKGRAAVESCELLTAAAEDADSVVVTNINVSGAAATADAAFVGSGFDGQTVTFALVERDGDWKLDRIEGFVEFDREKLLARTRSELKELPGSSSQPDVVECMIEGIEGFDNATLKEGVLSKVPAAMIALGESCAKRPRQL